ncbi:hypothetical protein [Prochlorococcus marinus]|uniref:Uncharacterized protein n=1 Tax=Prochlorococcus marinus (strain MIT 9211) TaxID=93059 RepID=A9B9Q0_PROM4|nr:hypothetical protein [Prochlorococcus marinus]ABX08562.1 Hypothetical protein P9211_06311 [Prochlorococcus marinus str. MIT 9211]
MKTFCLASLVLATQPAIETSEVLKVLGLMGLAATAGPLVIGGLFFLLKKGNLP